jgi:hypothetical protein
MKHRLPVGLFGDGWAPWVSTMATNFAISIVFAVLTWLISIGPFLLIHVPFTLIASIGVWLFYVQHQFDPTFWARNTEWSKNRLRMEARTTTCRQFCAGSPQISACIMCIIYAAASRTIACLRYCATIPNSAAVDHWAASFLAPSGSTGTIA